MSEPTSNNLELSVPELFKSPDEVGDGVILKPKNLETWIDQLPVASTTGSAKQIHRLLKKLNRLKLPPQLRSQLTELLIVPANNLMFILQNTYMDADFPLSPSKKHMALMVERLSTELAFANKWIIKDLTPRHISQADRKLLIKAMFYAMQQLSNSIYLKYLIYQIPAESIWYELHTLFRFASINNWLSFSLTIYPDDKKSGYVCTLLDLYLQTLVFAISAPMRLRQREMRSLYYKLLQWIKYVKLEPIAKNTDTDINADNNKNKDKDKDIITDIQKTDTCFIINTRGKEPPLHCSLVSPTLHSSLMIFSTHNLVCNVQKQCDSILDIGISPLLEKNELSKTTLQRILKAWNTAPRRRFARTMLNFELPLAVGMAAIYSLLLGKDASVIATTILDDSKQESELIALDSNIIENEDSVFDFIGSDQRRGSALLPQDVGPKYMADKDKTPAPDIWSTNTPSSSSPYIKLNTLNESIGGYCVNWDGANIPHIKIGELVGVPLPNLPNNCALTVVRWMHSIESNNAVQVGLELLAPKIIASKIVYGIKPQVNIIDCLLIPALENTDYTASVIVSPTSFKLHNNAYPSDVAIKENDAEVRVRLTELLEKNGAFIRFGFEAL